MKSRRQPFLLELGLNGILLSLSLLVAVFFMLESYRIHVENMALSKLQATMMTLSEDIRSQSHPDDFVLSYDAFGNEDDQSSNYQIRLTSLLNSNSYKVTLTLLNEDDVILSTWDLAVQP